MDPTGARLETFFDILRGTGETLDDYVNRLIINGAANIGAHELGHIAGLRKYFSLYLSSVAICDFSHTVPMARYMV